MRGRSRILSVLAALALAAALAPTATADAPLPEPPMVYCPAAADVSAVIDEPLTLYGVTRASCSYYGPNGGVSFDYFASSSQSDLVSLRAGDVPEDVADVDLPALGPGAYSYDGDEDVRVRWWADAQPEGRLYYLSVPLAHRNEAVSVATLLAGAIADAPLPTVPAKEFALKCPSTQQISQVMGRRVTLTPQNSLSCLFTDDERSISFSIVPGYGSIDDYRSRRMRDVNVNGAPPVALSDFSGLGPGAFSYADLSPTTVTWQLGDGVLASVRALENPDVLRRLALEFADVQKASGLPIPLPGAGTPGLPSTGN